jgi:hypothetical protein
MGHTKRSSLNVGYDESPRALYALLLAANSRTTPQHYVCSGRVPEFAARLARLADQCRSVVLQARRSVRLPASIEEICFQMLPDASRFKLQAETTHGNSNQCRSVCFAPVMIASAHCKVPIVQELRS